MEKTTVKTAIICGCIAGAFVLAGVVAGMIFFFSFLNGGFNSVMRAHLCNEENYLTCNITYKSVTIRGNGAYIEAVSADGDGKQKECILELTQKNVATVMENGFFKEVEFGSVLTVRTTLWIYMDNEFNYAAEIIFNGKSYLSFDSGFKNICDYIEENKFL